MTDEDQSWRPLMRRSAWLAAGTIGLLLFGVMVEQWLHPLEERLGPWYPRLVVVVVHLALDSSVIGAWTWLVRPSWRPVRWIAIAAVALMVPSAAVLQGLDDSVASRVVRIVGTVVILGGFAVIVSAAVHAVGRVGLRVINWSMRRRGASDLDTWLTRRLREQNRLQLVAIGLGWTGVTLLLAASFIWPDTIARSGVLGVFVAILSRTKLIFDGLGIGAITSSIVMWCQASPALQPRDEPLAPNVTGVTPGSPPIAAVLGAAAGVAIVCWSLLVARSRRSGGSGDQK